MRGVFCRASGDYEGRQKMNEDGRNHNHGERGTRMKSDQMYITLRPSMNRTSDIVCHKREVGMSGPLFQVPRPPCEEVIQDSHLTSRSLG